MRVAMFSNTYLPFVGGLTMSVSSYAASMRSCGHEVLVVVPEFEGQPEEETGVLRVPAIKHFANSRFSIPLFVYPQLSAALDAFQPDLLHAHHPYLLGDTALREASLRGLPLVVTHHTHALLYEYNLPEGLKWLAKFLDGLSTGFANLCDAVIAPSEGVRRELEAAGVERPIHVIPTGLEEARFARGDGAGFRAAHGIPSDAYVIGHVGRLAPEKNLGFLLPAVLDALHRIPGAYALIVGTGDMEESLHAQAAASPQGDRVCFAGVCTGRELTEAYHAMDVFAFASYSETQGMVVAEAMTAGKPVVALRARGVEDILRDGVNGRMVEEEDGAAFAEALHTMWCQRGDAWAERCRSSAKPFSLEVCTTRLLELYGALIDEATERPAPRDDTAWRQVIAAAEAQYDITANAVNAIISALKSSGDS
jgi:glycosyltransferase involved in cell wall biosynthesis